MDDDGGDGGGGDVWGSGGAVAAAVRIEPDPLRGLCELDASPAGDVLRAAEAGGGRRPTVPLCGAQRPERIEGLQRHHRRGFPPRQVLRRLRTQWLLGRYV